MTKALYEKDFWQTDRNWTMLADFYEFTMINGYFEKGYKDTVAVFDMFFRRVPDNGGFAIMAGLEQLIRYVQNLRFTPEDIEFLRAKKLFSEAFLTYLKNFEFTCDVWAIPEGTPIFPGEPIVKVKGPIIEAQFIETMVLVTVNHQSLIATKARRIVSAAKGRSVMEFGSRRAQGCDGALVGARAAYIGGCIGTSCTMTDRDFGIPSIGTMAHSWVQLFPSELEAFKAYAETYPAGCTLLVDTYDVLKSGVPNAIKTFQEVLVPLGQRPVGIRIDSGDIAYLSKEARSMLDKAGFKDCQIVASNSLDEYVIQDLLVQNAKIDVFGVGERLITAKSEPVFGGVYKMSAVQYNGRMEPKIKISENAGKITNPGEKETIRFYDKNTGIALADLLVLEGEQIDESKPYEIFDPIHTWKRKTLSNFTVRRLLEPVYQKGTLVYACPNIETIKAYCEAQMNTLWEEVRRLDNPHAYYVDLSQALWDMKDKLIRNHRK